MMVAIRFLKNFRRHPKEPSCFPEWHATLHQPGRRGVPQGVGGDLADKTGEFHSAFEPAFHGFNGLPIELDEAVDDQLTILPTPKVGQEARWYGCWRLPLFGGPLAYGLAIKDAVLKIDIRMT